MFATYKKLINFLSTKLKGSAEFVLKHCRLISAEEDCASPQTIDTPMTFDSADSGFICTANPPPP